MDLSNPENLPVGGWVNVYVPISGVNRALLDLPSPRQQRQVCASNDEVDCCRDREPARVGRRDTGRPGRGAGQAGLRAAVGGGAARRVERAQGGAPGEDRPVRHGIVAALQRGLHRARARHDHCRRVGAERQGDGRAIRRRPVELRGPRRVRAPPVAGDVYRGRRFVVELVAAVAAHDVAVGGQGAGRVATVDVDLDTTAVDGGVAPDEVADNRGRAVHANGKASATSPTVSAWRLVVLDAVTADGSRGIVEDIEAPATLNGRVIADSVAADDRRRVVDEQATAPLR